MGSINRLFSIELLLLAAAVVLFSFFNLSGQPVSPWDEARIGVNAVEMLVNGDWINLHYAGQPDSWNSKPPLFVWMVAGSFSLFGFHEFALRFPSAVATVLLFFVVYRIIRLYKDRSFAIRTCLILLSVKGLVGWHVGRTGDFDAMLTLLLVTGVYFFLRHIDFAKKEGLYLTGVCWGLAFLVKGWAALVLVPGVVLYCLLTGRFLQVLQLRKTWLSMGIFLLFPLSWLLLVRWFGITYAGERAGETAFELLFVQDIWERFTVDQEGWKERFDPSFFFYSVDKLFNCWNYPFFGFLLYLLVLFVKNRKAAFNYLAEPENGLLLLSLCLYFPLALFLSLASNSRSWYIAPLIPFIGIITYYGIAILKDRYSIVRLLFAGLLVFTLGRRLHDLSGSEHRPEVIRQHAGTFSEAGEIAVIGTLEQDVLLYLYFRNRALRFDTSGHGHLNRPGQIIFAENRALMNADLPEYRLVGRTGKYTVLRVGS